MNLFADDLITLSDLPGAEITQYLARLSMLRQRLHDLDDERAEIAAELQAVSNKLYVVSPDVMRSSNV